VRTRAVGRPDHYATLGLPPDASAEELGRAFRELAKRHHPDRPGGDAERFKAISEAWEVLGDGRQRREYDRTRVSREQVEQPERPGPRPQPPVRWTRRRAWLALGSGIALALLGLGVVALTVHLVADGAAFRAASRTAVATVLPGSPPEVVFTTESGVVVRVPEPRREGPGRRGETVAVRYDPVDPTEVRIDESTLARDLTLAIVAAKLLLGGVVLGIVGSRRL
jgi:hypothetical protein